MDEKIRSYKNDFLNYYENTAVKSNCGDITFINQGASTLTLNGALILRPGNSITLPGNYNEIDITIYNVNFTQVAGLNNELVVIRKVFI